MSFNKYYFTEEDAIRFANYLQTIKVIEWGEEYEQSEDSEIRLGKFNWSAGRSKSRYIYRDGFTSVKDLVDDVVRYLKERTD